MNININTRVLSDLSIGTYLNGRKAGIFGSLREAKLFTSVLENRQTRFENEWKESCKLLQIPVPTCDYEDLVLRFGGRLCR